jgi:hypothetical protein
MRKVYKFGEFEKALNENDQKSIPAIFLIKKTGEVLEKRGNIIFDSGIFDENNYKYLGAIGEDMQLYTTSKDTNSLFKFVNSGMIVPEDSNAYTEDNELNNL